MGRQLSLTCQAVSKQSLARLKSLRFPESGPGESQGAVPVFRASEKCLGNTAATDAIRLSKFECLKKSRAQKSQSKTPRKSRLFVDYSSLRDRLSESVHHTAKPPYLATYIFSKRNIVRVKNWVYGNDTHVVAPQKFTANRLLPTTHPAASGWLPRK